MPADTRLVMEGCRGEGGVVVPFLLSLMCFALFASFTIAEICASQDKRLNVDGTCNALRTSKDKQLCTSGRQFYPRHDKNECITERDLHSSSRSD